jgi:hypothetical protein
VEGLPQKDRTYFNHSDFPFASFSAQFQQHFSFLLSSSFPSLRSKLSLRISYFPPSPSFPFLSLSLSDMREGKKR